MVNKLAQIQAVIMKYPLLLYEEQKDHLIGRIEVYEGDSYEVKIGYLDNFPEDYPLVWEIADRIPLKAERHIYTDSKSCCLGTPIINKVNLVTRVKTLADFLDMVVVPYFQNNSYFEIKIVYKYGEYSHGLEGIWEGYFDALDVTEKQKVLNFLRHMISERPLLPTSKCYCGSGEKLNTCKNHRKIYRKLRKIPAIVFARDLKFLTVSEIRKLVI